NVLIFLCPSESQRVSFENFLKRKLAWKLIEGDKTLQLTDAQKKEVKERIKKTDAEEIFNLRNLYRTVLIPSTSDLKEIDLGVPTYQKDLKINKEVYERLRSEGDILENLSALVIKDRYLKDNDYVETKNLLETFYKTPGEIRIIKDEILKKAIIEGVKRGIFGFGRLEKGKPICEAYKEECEPKLVDGEIILQESLCKIEKTEPPFEAYAKPKPHVEPYKDLSDKAPSKTEEEIK
ncbi:MAG: AAA family ATPase, partial [Caldimicrobium sp.]